MTMFALATALLLVYDRARDGIQATLFPSLKAGFWIIIPVSSGITLLKNSSSILNSSGTDW